MLYEFQLTVPANTPASAPEELELLVPPQILTGVEVEMATGCRRMVNVVITQGKFQVCPRNPEGTIATDGHVVKFKEHYKIRRGDNILTAKAWSPDTDYSHIVTVRLEVQPIDLAEPFNILDKFVSALKIMFGIKG